MVIGGPLQRRRGPGKSPSSIARRAFRVTKLRSPQSRAVVIPARSNVWALCSARKRRSWSSSSANRRRTAAWSGPASKTRWTCESISPGNSVWPGRSRKTAPSRSAGGSSPWQTASIRPFATTNTGSSAGAARAINQARGAAPAAAQRHRSSSAPKIKSASLLKAPCLRRHAPAAVVRHPSGPLLPGTPTPRAAPPRSPGQGRAHRARRSDPSSGWPARGDSGWARERGT